ncbi:hypothetical protein LZ31DRAFT_578819 [Colletotrichum somersetense]|nr:hypothetical protein LZ31DRAFT_578819 [Colletotrichum somersetense]
MENVKSLTKSDFDSKSIMCYIFPPEWTLDKQFAPQNQVFSDNDKSFINRMYPFRTRNKGLLDIFPGIRTYVDNVVPLNSKGIDFSPPYLTQPRLALGLTQIDQANNANVRVRLEAESITEKGFILSMDTWSDSVMNNAGVTWLEFLPSEESFQVGSYSTLDDRDIETLAQPIYDEATGIPVRRDVTDVCVGMRINHEAGPRTRDLPPPVLLYPRHGQLGLDLGKEANWRIKCYAQEITHKGFELVIEIWADTICYSASASWVAYPADQEGVESGKVSSLDVRNRFPPVAKTKGKVSFASKDAFDKTPKVFFALSALDMDNAKNMRVKVFVDTRQFHVARRVLGCPLAATPRSVINFWVMTRETSIRQEHELGYLIHTQKRQP